MSSLSGLYEVASDVAPEPAPPVTPSPIPDSTPVIPWWVPPWLIPWLMSAHGPHGAPGIRSSSARRASAATFTREHLCLDVDGHYPQMLASGTAKNGLATRVHWIAEVAAVGVNRWSGNIWYKDGDAHLWPYTRVDIRVEVSSSPSRPRVTATFSGGAGSTRTAQFLFVSRYFHEVEFEYDHVQGVDRVTEIDTNAHPNHPAHLPGESLSVEETYRRAGFDVSRSGGDSAIPISGAGPNATWSDMEMHDAMQTYWSRFMNRANWSMWVLFAPLHDDGASLGGVMFDDIGPNHRQGTAVFNDSFISNAPNGDLAPDAWVARMRFWTVVHEMGHAFNLAHSWQKQHPPSWGSSWVPLQNEPEARSFMNYPYNVAGGQSAFFSDFEFRFSDAELEFIRHAPERFVQMGNADWFDDHGFRQAALSPEPLFSLELRVRPYKSSFDFLEPIVLEAKLTNISDEPQNVAADVLTAGDHTTVVLKRQSSPARQWYPLARYCYRSPQTSMAPGASAYDSFFMSAGLNGWDIAEPGTYAIQMALRIGREDIVSNALHVKILPPLQRDEEVVAQDYFAEDVGRVLAFDGSRYLSGANEVLQQIVDQFPNGKAAFHAKVALGNPLRIDYKRLALGKGERTITAAADDNAKFEVSAAQVEEGREILEGALIGKPAEAVETLGHIDYRYYVDLFADWLEKNGDNAAAAGCQSTLHDTLAASKNAGHVVSASVLAEIATRAKQLLKT